MPPDLKCPSCGDTIPWAAVRLGHPFRLNHTGLNFVCPGCSRLLELRRSYRLPLHYLSLTLAGTVAYGVGLRGWLLLLVGIAAGALLVSPTVLVVAVHLVRPDLQEVGDVRTILYGVPSPADTPEADATVLAGEADALPASAPRDGERRALFASPPRPRTLEGTAIALGFLLLGAFFAWASIEPLLVAHLPGYWVTRNGPPQMPLTARVTRDYMELNNATDILLLCRLRLNAGAVGNPTRYVESGRSVWYLETQVYLEPGKSKIVGYLDLPGVDTDVEVRAVRLAALGEIGLECGSSSVSLN